MTISDRDIGKKRKPNKKNRKDLENDKYFYLPQPKERTVRTGKKE